MERIKQKQYVDVTQPPFNAVGDGEADDAPAFQKAVDSIQGGHVTLPDVEQSPDANDDHRS